MSYVLLKTVIFYAIILYIIIYIINGRIFITNIDIIWIIISIWLLGYFYQEKTVICPPTIDKKCTKLSGIRDWNEKTNIQIDDTNIQTLD